METTDFQDILSEAATEVTALDPDNLSTAEFRAIRRSAKQRLEVCWEYHFWPDLDRMEQRFYRPPWDPTVTYNNAASGTGDPFEVYYAPTQKYYQALQGSTNQAPATINPDGSQTVNLLYWALSTRYYAASTYSSTTLYSQGMMAQYGDSIYQLFTAGPISGDLPTDAANWGLLTPFDQYILYEQPGLTPFTVVNSAWSTNPRTSTRGRELNWSLSNNGLQISSAIHFAWVDYRIRCPKLSGDLYNAATAYQPAAQMYYTSAATPGNFFINAFPGPGPTPPGENPDNALNWDVVAIPRIFHKYMVHAIAADWIRGPGGGAPEDAEAQMQVAEGALEDMKTLLVMQQSQRVKTVVQTR